MAHSYIPFYRKYRPQKFSDLIGQDSISKTLCNAIKLNRVAHAYLFTGPRGTGKTSSARIFAKSLNCQEGPTVDPCGKCPSCIDITASNSVDVIEMDAASNRKVEDARNILEKVQFVPVAGKYKIYIIDEVHMLTTEAFNTLLKTLEEPPDNLIFILATTEVHKVLNTIISRCQRFDFKRVTLDLIIGQLRNVAVRENLLINDRALSVIARRSFGGMRDALSLLDQASVLSSDGSEITESHIYSILGSLSEENLFGIAQSIADKSTETLITYIDKVVESCEPVNVIRELINYFRNLLIIKTCENTENIFKLIDISEGKIPELASQAKQFEAIELIGIIEKLSEHERTMKNTTRQHLWLEVALIGICHRQDIQVLKDMEQRISKLEELISSGNISAPERSPLVKLPQKNYSLPANRLQETYEPVQTLPKNIEEKQDKFSEKVQNIPSPANGCMSDLWNSLTANIESIPSRMFYLNLAKPVEITPERIIITFSNESLVKQAKSKIEPLETSAQKVFGTIPQIILRVSLSSDTNIMPKAQNPDTQKEKNYYEPSHKIEPPKSEKTIQIAIDVESSPVEETELIETASTEEESKVLTRLNLPEQAKIILELFNGKIIE